MNKMILLFFFQTLQICISQEPVPEQPQDFDAEVQEQSDLELYSSLHPLDLNTVTLQQLLILPWLDPLCAKAVIDYRNKNGRFRECSELAKIDCLLPEDYEQLTVFVHVADNRPAVHAKLRQRLFEKLNKVRGYENGSYLGSPQKMYTSIQIGMKDCWNMGLVLEKDAGEQMYDDHFILTNQVVLPNLCSKIVFGHFSFDYGYGLVFGSGQRYNSSDAFYSARERNKGLSPCHSADENNLFSGIGMQSTIANLDFAIFYSRNSIDGNLQHDSISSVYSSGYHRTIAEQKKKDTVSETVCGFSGMWRDGLPGECCLLLQYDSFHRPWLKNASVEDAFDFSGKRNWIIGLNYHVMICSLDVFCELARSHKGGNCIIAGGRQDWNHFGFIFLVRHYGKNFHNFHSSIISGNGSCHEKMIQCGWKWQLERSIQISLSLNRTAGMWSRSSLLLPAPSYEWLWQVEKKTNNGTGFQFRFRQKMLPSDEKMQDVFGRTVEKTFLSKQKSLRAQISYRFKKHLLRTQCEWIFSDPNAVNFLFSDSTGFLMYHEMTIHPVRDLTCKMRFTFFDTPSSKESFYPHESDLPGMLRSKMLYGLGCRWYYIFGYQWNSTIGFFFKFEQTLYHDRTSIGTGDDLYPGNEEKAISLQIDIEL